MAIVAPSEADAPPAGSYTVELAGVGAARYEHRKATPPTAGMTIQTTRGWARIIEVTATPSASSGGHLRAKAAPPPPAVRPVCPDY
jgi:hypothetical protein